MPTPSWCVASVNPPSVLSADYSGGASGALNPALPGTIIREGGFDIELVFVPTSNLGGSDFELLAMEGPETAAGTAATRIWYDATTGGWNVTVGGVFRGSLSLAGLGDATQVARTGDRMKARLAWWPSHGLASFELEVNGCRTTRTTQTPTATAVGEPTSLYLGRTIAGGSTLPAQWHSLKTVPIYASAHTRPAEIVLVADSMFASLTLAQYSSSNSIGSLIYTAGEYASRRGVACMAYPGHSILQQTAAWTASRFPGDGMVRAVVIQLGINDVITGRTISECRTDYQALVDLIAADCPQAAIIVCSMPPCKGYAAIAAAFSVFQGLNTSIAGGASPITGVDARVTSHYPLMCTGVADFLDAALDVSSPDYLHQNNAGRLINVAPIRAALVTAGVL